MKFSQDQLRAFYEITRRGSFTKAAQELGLTQSALSHRVKNLEDQLETALFVRDPAGVRLTDAGSKLLQHCRVLSQIEAEFLEDFTAERTQKLHGYLRIGGASTLMWSVVTKALGTLLRENPDVQVEMMSRELADLPKILTTGAIDLIVTCGRADLPGCEEVHLGDEKNVLVESAQTTARHAVYLDHDPSDRTTFEYLKAQGVRETTIKRAYMDNIQGILAGVEQGFGKAVVPLHLLGGAKVKRVKNQKELKTPVYLYFARQAYYTRLHKDVVAALTTNVPRILSDA